MKIYICKKCKTKIAVSHKLKHNLTCGRTTNKSLKLNNEQKEKVNKLLKVCRKYEGEYLGSDHGPGSWATSYHGNFISGVTDIYLILKENLLVSPLNELEIILRNNNIRSCRGGLITGAKLNYLFKKIEDEIYRRENY